MRWDSSKGRHWLREGYWELKKLLHEGPKAIGVWWLPATESLNHLKASLRWRCFDANTDKHARAALIVIAPLGKSLLGANCSGWPIASSWWTC